MKYNKVQSLYTSRIDLYLFFIYITGYVRGVTRFLRKKITLKSGMNILDTGCGTGLLTKILFKKSVKEKIPVSFYCFDFTPVMLHKFEQWIKKHNAQNINLARADLLTPETIPSAWPACSLVMVSGMLEYIPRNQISTALKTLASYTTSNGRLLIFICKTNWFNKLIITKWWRAHTYTKNELIDLCDQAGLAKPTFYLFSWPYTYLNSFVHILEIRK